MRHGRRGRRERRSAPVLVYFRETATARGQGHLFPVLTDPTRLRELMTERVGVGKLVATPPSL